MSFSALAAPSPYLSSRLFDIDNYYFKVSLRLLSSDKDWVLGWGPDWVWFALAWALAAPSPDLSDKAVWFTSLPPFSFSAVVNPYTSLFVYAMGRHIAVLRLAAISELSDSANQKPSLKTLSNHSKSRHFLSDVSFTAEEYWTQCLAYKWWERAMQVHDP